MRNAVPSVRAACVLFVLPERQKKVDAHCGGRVAPKHRRTTGCMDKKAKQYRHSVRPEVVGQQQQQQLVQVRQALRRDKIANF